MDEPTTHLDIMSIDALIAALKTYEGTLYFVSHDVHFIREIAKTVLHVHSGRLTQYAGDYAYYLEKSKAGNERAALTAGFTDGRPKQAEAAKAEKPKAPVKPSAADIRKLKSEVTKFEQQVILKNGQTLVLSGFERQRTETENRGVGSPRFLGLGGVEKGDIRRASNIVFITPRLLSRGLTNN
jgi:ATP-binding cassette subfamily F protein 3